MKRISKFKKGDIVKVLRNDYFHEFLIGERVEILDVRFYSDGKVNDYICKSIGRPSEQWYCLEKELELVENKEFLVDEDFIKAAHKVACSEWKSKIEAKFPEVFVPKEELFNFGNEYKMNFISSIMIGLDLVDDEYRNKSIVAEDGWEPEIRVMSNGRKAVVFVKK